MLLRFDILNPEDMQQVDGIDYPILINSNQIVTIKSISIMYKGNLIKGYWIRTSNGKKYKATRIPQSLEVMLNNSENLTEIDLNGRKVKDELPVYLN